MKIIDFETIKNLNIPKNKYYEWVSQIINEKREMILPAKISMKPDIDGVFYNCMPSILPKYDWAGVKLVTRYPKRIPSLTSELLLYDLKTGHPIALMDATYITAMRTGAVAVHTILLLAKKQFQTIGFIGLGNTARATLKILLSVEGNRKLKIKLLKYKNQHIVFANEFENKNLTFEFYDTPEEVIGNSDVIISAVTVLKTDICEDKYFAKGCLVVPIHTRGFTNCDLFFDKVYADDVNHVKGFKYFSRFKAFAETCDVVNGSNPGRENNNERILAYNIGISLHDVFFAGKISEMAKDIVDVDLKQPIDKFWL